MSGEMTEGRKVGEMLRILNYIYSQSKTVEVTPGLAKIWIDQLHGFSLAQCQQAAKALLREKTYGEPRFSDFWECLKKVAYRPARYNPWCEEKGRIERAADVLQRLEIGCEERKLLE